MKKKKNSQKDFISLDQASKHCDYSQEYLSLRARQGKLKAVKIGRNWVTKKAWLVFYIKHLEKKNRLSKNRKRKFQKKNKTVFAVEQKLSVLGRKEILPPDNLPIGQFGPNTQNFLAQEPPRENNFHSFALSCLAFFMVAVVSFIYSSDFKKTFNDFDKFSSFFGDIGTEVIVSFAQVFDSGGEFLALETRNRI